MAKIPQKTLNHFCLLHTSDTSVVELHKIVTVLHLRKNAKYLRYENT